MRFHLSTVLFLSLDRDLCAPITGATMCHGSWDISQNLGLDPEPRLPLTLRACVFTNSARRSPHVACNLLLLILLKHVLQQQFSSSVHLYKTEGWFVPNLADIKLQASLTWPYILMKPWSHSFTNWFTLQSSEVLNQRDFNPLFFIFFYKICKSDATSCLFPSHVAAFGPKPHFHLNSFIRQVRQWLR